MRAVDIDDFNQKILNQVYKELETMVDKVDKNNIDDLLILQEKLGSLLLILRKENDGGLLKWLWYILTNTQQIF